MYYSVSVEEEALELFENAVFFLRCKEIFSTRLFFLSGNFFPFFFGKFLKKTIWEGIKFYSDENRIFQRFFKTFPLIFRQFANVFFKTPFYDDRLYLKTYFKKRSDSLWKPQVLLISLMISFISLSNRGSRAICFSTASRLEWTVL